MDHEVTQSNLQWNYFFLKYKQQYNSSINSNARRDVHHGPKTGFDFVSKVPNSHEEKQRVLNNIG